MADPQVSRESHRAPLARPLFWRLPLIVLLVIGLGCLRFLDTLLQREYRSEAVSQAVQTDALLEGFLRQRVGLLHGLEVLLSASETTRSASARFATLAREVLSDAPDALSVARLDERGVVQDTWNARRARGLVAVGSDDATDPPRAAALARAADTRRPAFTSTVQLGNGRPGLVVYDPILRDGRIAGFVAGTFAHVSLFTDALGGQLQGQFAYRVLDDRDRLIAESPDFPSSVAELVRREVTLPDGQRWTLEVGVPRFQPAVARFVLWGVGLLLLLLAVFIVIREEQRTERLATHSFHLELLSRDLLDANLRLEERAQQVTEANRAKSRFLANVSHELRTPLNAIVGYNGLALDGVYGPLPAPLESAHQRIAQAAEHLLGVVNDVLDLSKIEVGRMRAELEPVDLRSVIDSVVTVVDPIASAKGVPVDVVVARDLPRITTDPRHVRQILLNLASNAVKFTDRGSVAIVARRDERDPSRVALAVHDTGIGVAPADHERIFDEFEQVRPGGRGDSQQRGTGLGLAISRKLARLLAGDVFVESEQGQGSRFTLVLPIEPPAALAAQAAADDAEERASLHRPTAREAASSERSRLASSAIDAPAAWNPDTERTPPEARPAVPYERGGGLDDGEKSD